MMRFPAPAALHGDNLRAEVVAAGYQQVHVAVVGDELEVSAETASGNPIDERSRDTIQAVIDAHTGQPTEEQQRPAKVRAKVEERIIQAEDAYANWAKLTNAQKDAVLRNTVLAVAKLARLALSKFDAAE